MPDDLLDAAPPDLARIARPADAQPDLVPDVDPGPKPVPDAAVDGPPPDGPVPCDCADNESCVDEVCVQTLWVFEAEAPDMSHDTGARTATGWGARAFFDRPYAFLVRGPGTSELPPGRYQATYVFRIGAAAALIDIATLDVNDLGPPGGIDCAFCILGSRSLTSMDVPQDDGFHGVSLEFDLVGGEQRIEFRVIFLGVVDLEVDRIEVRHLSN